MASECRAEPPVATGERLVITLSGGLTGFASGDSLEQAFERADQALYQAKGSGRNRIIRAAG